MEHVPVAIVGAGLAGMSAAFHLRRAGVACRVFERAARPGGHAVTAEERGYRFDRTGHLLHLSDPDIAELAAEWIGPERRTIERDSRVWSHGVYTRYPFQANAFGLPPEVAHECVMGFLAAQARAHDAPRDFEEFCLQRFGEAISRRFMIPYNTRLWGVPPREITAEWCARFVPVPTVDDVIAGAVGLDRRLGYNARFVYPNRGIGALSDGLCRAIGGVELEREVTAIDPRARTLEVAGARIGYDALVATLPLPLLVARMSGVPDEVRAAAAELRATHLHYLDLALTRPAGVPYQWIYVPEEKYPFYRVGCYSAFSPEMAPPGRAALWVELVDRAEPDLARLLPEVARSLVEMGVLGRADDVAFARARRIDWAYVIFDHRHYPALEVVHPYLAACGIVAAGRYGAWNYSSMADALRFGREAADEVIARAPRV